MAPGKSSKDGRSRSGWSIDPIDKSSAASPQATSSIIIIEAWVLLLVLAPANRVEVLLLLIGIMGLVATPLTGALELDFSDMESAEDALLQVEVPLLGSFPPRSLFFLIVCRDGDDDLDCIPIPK
jgi:hypothetical protein